MSIDDYEQVHQLSSVEKYNLMEESPYQVLREASLFNQVATSHTKPMFPNSSSQEVEDSKSLYDLDGAKRLALRGILQCCMVTLMKFLIF